MYKILFSAFVGSKLHDQTLSGLDRTVFYVDNSITSCKIASTAIAESNARSGRYLLILISLSPFPIKAIHRGKCTEAELSLVFFFYKLPAVEVFLREIPAFLESPSRNACRISLVH
jgi:hypothetical protein